MYECSSERCVDYKCYFLITNLIVIMHIFIGLGGFMACLATLQSTVEKPKELEESSSDDSIDGIVKSSRFSILVIM